MNDNQSINNAISPFSADLQGRIEKLRAKRSAITLGRISFASKLILAPLSGITSRPFRLLMEDLGSGGSISELVSCHGICHGNQRTLDMLKIDPREKHVGLQIFGEDAETMAKSAKIAQEYNPKFVDINMGCPAKKVVKRGSGSALLKDLEAIPNLLKTIKESIELPLTIKIRLGWSEDDLNAAEVIKLAEDNGIEFISIHGRTQAQAYRGQANWKMIEELAKNSKLPIIGNGDLHTPTAVREKLANSGCDALMLGRGSLRNPFIFLEALSDDHNPIFFAEDYWEVSKRFHQYVYQMLTPPKMKLVLVKKMLVWFSAGLPGCVKLRGKIFENQEIEQVLEMAQEFFLNLGKTPKAIDSAKDFLSGGHG